MAQAAKVSTSVPAAKAAKPKDDITECPLCHKIFTDPILILPCVHTFCLDCISKRAEGQPEDDKLACPLCRKEIKIPGSSVASSRIKQIANLPKNLFMQKVADVRKLSLSGPEVLCDVCCEGGDDGNEEIGKAKKAVARCVECSQNFCKQCRLRHQKMKVSMKHQLVEWQEKMLDRSPDTERLFSKLLLELPENTCEQHDDILTHYCHDCNLPICKMCVADIHKPHKLSDIEQLADAIRVQMKANAAGIVPKLDKCSELLSKMENFSRDFDSKIETSQKLVTETAAKIKQAVDDYKVKLLDQLKLAKKDHEQKAKSMRQELETTMLTMEMFKQYYQLMEGKGTASDVVMSASHLHARAFELIQNEVYKGFPRERLMDVNFSSPFSTDQLGGFFGEVSVSTAMCRSGGSAWTYTVSDTNFMSPAKLLGIIPGGAARQNVTGITLLGNDVYIVHQYAQNIEVYDAGTLTLQRSLPVGLPEANQSSLAACQRNQCIYMSTCSPDLIRRIDLVPCDKLFLGKSSWPTARAPTGIAVNRDANLLVTCRSDRKVQEFSIGGKLVREIVLQTDMNYPVHAVQLSGDQFGVTHAGTLHRFCIVGPDGCIVRSYGGKPGSDDEQLALPSGIAAIENGDHAFVADKENNRVLMLNLKTMSATPLNVDLGSDRLKFPFCIYFEQSRGRLYIGERGGACRIIVVAVGE